MRETKLFKLLETFSKKERSDFRAFLLSPYHNAQPDLVRFFTLIFPAIKDKQAPALEEDLIAQGFPENIGDATFVRNLKHALLKAAKRFLAVQKFQADASLQAWYLVRDARERNGNGEFSKEWEKQEKESLNGFAGQQDPEALYLRFQLGMEQVKVRARANRRSADSFLVETMQRLNDFYLLQKLQLACAHLSDRNIVATETTIPGPQLDAFWVGEEVPQATVMGLYRCVYQMLMQPDDAEHYTLFVNLLLQSSGDLSPKTFLELFMHALNECSRRINRVQPGAKMEYLDLFKRAQTHPEVAQLLLEKPFLCKNVVQVAASLGDFSFAQAITDATNDKAFPIGNAYNQAVIFFYQGKLSAAAKLLIQVVDETKDRFYHLDSLVYLLLIDYQTEDDRFDSLYDRFRMHVFRNEEIAQPHKQKFRAFQNFLLQLMKIQARDIKGLQTFRETVRQDQGLQGFLWVFDWLDQMRVVKK